MIKAEYRFHLPVGPQEAFQVLSDPRKDPDWQGACVRTRLLGATLGAGSRYEITFEMLGKRLDFVVELTDFEPGVRSRFVTVDGPFHYVGEYRYQAGDGGTDVHWTFDVEPGDFFGILPKSLMKKVLVSQVKKDSSALSARMSSMASPS